MVHELYEKLRASELRSFGTSPFGLRTFRNLFLAVDVLQRGNCDRSAIYGTLNYCGMFVDEKKKLLLDELHARSAGFASGRWASWTCLYQLLIGYSASCGRCLSTKRLARIEQVYEKLVRD